MGARVQLGFTIMEIIVVVVILGVLAALAIPKVTGPNEQIKSGEGQQILVVLLGAQKRYALENGGNYAASADISVTNPLDISIPSSANFNPASLYNNVDLVAKVSRSTGAYSLGINETGIIYCSGGANCNAIHCNKVGPMSNNQCN